MPTPSAAPQTVEELKELPTPVSPGKLVVYDDLEVVMVEAEITDSYINEYGSNREAPAGKKLLWIHITIKNIGQNEQVLPASEHYSVLNARITPITWR